MADKLIVVLVHGRLLTASMRRPMMPKLDEEGHRAMRAQNSITPLADDLATTRKLAEWMRGLALLVGHRHRGAIFTKAGRAPNVVGVEYIAKFAPEVGEEPTGRHNGAKTRSSRTFDVEQQRDHGSVVCPRSVLSEATDGMRA
jgi:hypothetical protein